MNSHRRRKRRGTVLILFVMLLFVFLGMCALVVDLGMARLAQRQMQSAADTAALEAFRDRENSTVAARNANALVDLAYAGLSQPSASEAVRPYASDNAARHPYQPQLQANASNDAAGDIVRGKYGSGTAHTNFADEQSDYSRRDFTGDSDAPDAVLVRLRRTNESFEGSTSSSAGPPSPVLFGHGALINFEQKRAGISLRATAIAHATNEVTGRFGRVMSVGPVYLIREENGAASTESVAGLAPFAIHVAAWNAAATMLTFNVDATTGALAGPDGNGSVIELPVPVAQPKTPPVFTLGHQVVAVVNDLSSYATENAYYRYVPIYDTVDDRELTIIGFGDVNWSLADASLTVTKHTDVVGRDNVSTVLVADPADLESSARNAFIGPDASADFSTLWAAHNSIENSLLAPVLVNRHIGPSAN